MVDEKTAKPQPGFSVVARADGGVELKTETDQKGRFVFDTLSPNIQYTLRAETPPRLGFSAAPLVISLAPGESRQDLVILLREAPSSISGYVFGVAHKDYGPQLQRLERHSLEGLSLQDIIGPVIGPSKEEGLSGVLVRLEGEDGSREATSLFQGLYEFPSLRAGHYTLTAFAPGSGSSRGEQKAFSQEVDLAPYEHRRGVNLYLRADAVVMSGRVVDSAGKPLAGVRIAAVRRAAELRLEQPDVRHSLSTQTDQQGEYRLDGLIPPNLFYAATYLFGNPREEEVHYVIAAESDGYVSAEASVPILPESIRSVAARFGAVLVRYEGGGETQSGSVKEIPLPESKGNDITGVDFVLLKGATVAGVLEDLQGNALPALGINMKMAMPPAAHGSASRPRTTEYEVKSDATGRFRCVTVGEGVYSFRVAVAGVLRHAAPDPFTVHEGETISDVRVTVDARDDRGAISGVVTSASTGKPIQGFDVRVRDVVSVERQNAGDDASGGQVTMPPENPGAFLIEGVSSGTAEVCVSAPGFGPQTIWVKVQPGATSSASVALEDEGILRVRAICDGQLAEAETSALPDGAEISVRASTTTDDGWQIIKGLAPGGYVARATSMSLKVQGAHAVLRSENRHVNVDPGTTQDIELDLSGACGLRVRVSGPEPIQVLVLDAAADVPDPTKAWNSQYARLTAQQVQCPGNIEVQGLPEGAYRIVAWPVSQPGRVSSCPAVLRPGQTSEVQFDF